MKPLMDCLWTVTEAQLRYQLDFVIAGKNCFRSLVLTFVTPFLATGNVTKIELPSIMGVINLIEN